MITRGSPISGNLHVPLSSARDAGASHNLVRKKIGEMHLPTSTFYGKTLVKNDDDPLKLKILKKKHSKPDFTIFNDFDDPLKTIETQVAWIGHGGAGVACRMPGGPRNPLKDVGKTINF